MTEPRARPGQSSGRSPLGAIFTMRGLNSENVSTHSEWTSMESPARSKLRGGLQATTTATAEHQNDVRP